MRTIDSRFRRRLLAVAVALVMAPWAVADDSAAGDLANPMKGPTALYSLDDFATLSGATSLADNGLLGEGWSFGGFVETAYSYNWNRPSKSAGASENAGRVFDTENGDITLHSALLSIQKEATDESWVGGTIAAMVGHDAKFIHADGLNDGDDFDLVDAFFTLRVPGDVKILGGGELKVGKFQKIVGSESIYNTDNVNYSRSLAFGHAIPLVHVGALYSQDVAKNSDGEMLVGIDLGIVNSIYGRAEDDNRSKGYASRIRVAPVSWMDFHVAGLVGNEIAGGTPDSDSGGLLDVVANIRMPDGVPEALQRLSFILNYDFGGQESRGQGGSAKWVAYSGIAKYQFNKQWYAAFRGEAFRDSDGTRIALLDGVSGEVAKDYIELTATVGYEPWDNFLVRAEWRYDKADESVFGDHLNSDGFDNHQNTVALDTIVKF